MNPLSLRETTWYFLLQFLNGYCTPQQFVNYRLIHNEQPFVDEQGNLQKPTIRVYNANHPVRNLKDTFLREGGLFDQFMVMARDVQYPANVYFGVNPRSSTKNKRSDIPFVVGLRADLDHDDHAGPYDKQSGYSAAERFAQIQFLNNCGMMPSMIVDSGYGFHLYWMLDAPADVDEAQKLNRLICKFLDSDAVHDGPRIMRIPGFPNQKRWYTGLDQPTCTLIHPSSEEVAQNYAERKNVRRFSMGDLSVFPDCRKQAMQKYVQQAEALEGDFQENLKRLIQQAAAERNRQRSAEAAVNIVDSENRPAPGGQENATETPLIAQLPPDIDEIKFPTKNKKWMRLYIKKGTNLTPEERSYVLERTGMNDLDESELDAKVMFALICLRYSFEAIEAFWQRSDVALWRQDKMDSSPDYLRLTYDSMLNAREFLERSDQQDAIEAAEQNLENEFPVVYDFKTFVKGAKGKLNWVLNGELILKAKFTNLDAQDYHNREYYNCDVKVKDPAGTGSLTYNITFPRSAFDSIQSFKRYCRDQLSIQTNTHGDLQRIVHHLESNFSEAARHTFNTSLAYDVEQNQFRYPTLRVAKDKMEHFGGVALSDDLKKDFPWHAAFVEEIPDIEEVKRLLSTYWGKVLNLHQPSMVMSVIGLIGITPFETLLRRRDIYKNMHIPTVNVWGRSSSGKTLSVQVLYKLTGATDSKLARFSLKSSKFALTTMCSQFEFVPLFIDEFKEEKSMMEKLQDAREVIRTAYTGETIYKGTVDRTLRATPIMSRFIVCGENQVARPGDISEHSRIITINTDGHRPDETFDIYEELEMVPLWKIGAYFNQYMLNIDIERRFEEFKTVRREVMNRAKNFWGDEATRVGHNIACILYGCKLWDDFVKSMVPGLPSFQSNFKRMNLIDHLGNQSLEDTQSLRHTEEATVKRIIDGVEQDVVVHKTVITARDEAMEFLQVINHLMENNSREVREAALAGHPFVYVEPNRDHLLVQLSAAHDAYTAYKERTTGEVIPLPTIRQRIKGAHQRREIYVESPNKRFYRNKRTAIFAVFKLSTLIAMNLWTFEDKNERTGSDEANDSSDSPNWDESETKF